MTADHSNSFERQGFTILHGFFNAGEMANLFRLVDPVHAQWLRQHRDNYVGQLLVNMHSLTSAQYFADSATRIRFFDSITPEKLTCLVDAMFGDGIYFHNTQLFFNPFENRRLPYWHRDLQYSPIEDAAQAREQVGMLSLHIRIPLIAEQGIEIPHPER